MSVNPYTLNQLYANGIIDYIPDLGQGGIGFMNGFNPYMNMAMRGASYQNYGSGRDSFTMSSRPGVQDQEIGSQSQAHNNMFGLSGIGTQTNTGISNLYGQAGIGEQNNMSLSNSYGGYADVKNRVNGVYSSVVNAPAFVKGLASIGILIGTVLMLKGKKKPKPQPQQGFWSRINPFKSKKTKK